MPIQTPKMFVGIGEHSHRGPQIATPKRTSFHRNTSYDVLIVEINPPVLDRREPKNNVTNAQQ